MRVAAFFQSGLLAGWLMAVAVHAEAESFRLPTANTALFDRNGFDRYFVGTVGKPWKSGTFGCVRTDGWQLHEGLDIRSLQRDKRGEPLDPILATADGVVAYLNPKSALSNYGKYIILRHLIDGVEVYSTYAHLSELRGDLRAGTEVKAGEPIGVMGRTANTREGISKDRAHLHFELNLFLNDRFAAWHKQNLPGQRNDHGMWNGQNLVGFDPAQLLLEQRRLGDQFNLLGHLRTQNEQFRVQVRATDFPFLRRYPGLITQNPAAQQAGVSGYEIAFSFSGVPMELTPRGAAELKSKSRIQLLSVKADEYRTNPCRKLVRQRNGRWELTTAGRNLVELLIY